MTNWPASETPLSARTSRHLELLKLAHPLRRYASTLHADLNASSLLVHRALSAAFTEQPGLRASTSLESSLRDDIHRQFKRDAHGAGGSRQCAVAE